MFLFQILVQITGKVSVEVFQLLVITLFFLDVLIKISG